jgi:hypothetical protein
MQISPRQLLHNAATLHRDDEIAENALLSRFFKGVAYCVAKVEISTIADAEVF